MMTSLFQQARSSLAQQGGRMTAQRRLILEALEELSGHPTAEELYEVVRPRAPDLNLSTIYRTLRWLEQEGLVNSRWFEMDRGQERFDAAVSPAEEHHHFVCNHCKTVIEFSSPLIAQIKKQFERQAGVRVEAASVVLHGYCPDCQANLKKD